MQKKHCKIASLGIFMLLFTLMSCVDNAYDLNKDIDMTISVGGSEFAVPGGNTDKWTLDQLLDLDTTGIIKTDVNGNYALKKKGDDSDPSNVNIEAVTVDAPDIEDIDIDLVFQSGAPGYLRVSSDSMVVNIPDNKKSSFELRNSNMPVELLTLSYVVPKNMYITLAIEGPANLSLREMTIEFPEYMDIEGAKNGVYRLPSTAIIEGGGIYKKTLRVLGMRIQKDAYQSDKRLLEVKDDIFVKGKFWMSKSDYNAAGSNISRNVLVSIAMNDMEIETVTGTVDPKIDIKVSPVQLTDIPDFLNGDDVTLDLENPMILLQVVNESPVDVNAIGKFVSKKNGKALTDTIRTENIFIKGGTSNLICLSKTGVSPYQGYTNVKVPGLSALLEKVPEEIVFSVYARSVTDREFTMQLGYDYQVKSDYEVDAPLAFGENLEIVYKDTIDGWNSDLKDYEVKKLELRSTAYNSIPLDVTLTSEAVDVNGKILEGIEATVDKTIPAGSGNKGIDGVFEASETVVVISMIEKVPGMIKKLDGVRLSAKAVVNKGEANGRGSTVGKNLNENQYLQLKEIRLKVPGGVKIDLN